MSGEDTSGKDRGRSGDGEISPADREALRQRSAGIGRRLDEVKTRRNVGRPSQSATGAAYGQAFKIAAELVAGLLFGGALGWFLDKQFDTMPVLLIIGVVVGFVAGMLNVIRGAREAQARAEPLQRSSPSVADDNEEDEK